jgi:hypothetical protein
MFRWYQAVDHTQVMLGTFSPRREPYIHVMEEETAPTGVLARGSYTSKTKVYWCGILWTICSLLCIFLTSFKQIRVADFNDAHFEFWRTNLEYCVFLFNMVGGAYYSNAYAICSL